MFFLIINTMDLFKAIHTNLFSAATVGFARTLYRVRETNGYVQVCLNVKQPRGYCPVQRPFSVILDTFDGTAGIHCYIPNTCEMEYVTLLQLLHKIMNVWCLESYLLTDVIQMNVSVYRL